MGQRDDRAAGELGQQRATDDPGGTRQDDGSPVLHR
jgi:hypothetical protein